MNDIKWIKECPVCGEQLRLTSGCYRCPNCGHSTCGNKISPMLQAIGSMMLMVALLIGCFFCTIDDLQPRNHTPADKQGAVTAQTRIMQQQVSSINARYEREAK